MSPTFGSLFAGIGGIDLGLERAGWTGRWQVEWDPFCQHVLAHHWPDVPRYGDITKVDWSTVEPVDLIAGGFPCQPFSMAGKRRGTDDDRWLWPEFARAIGALRPRYVLVENVPGLLAGHGGMGAVLGDLADLGYDAEWDSVPAAAVGAPHLRYRVWIVAYASGRGSRRDGSGPVEVPACPREGSDTDGRRREADRIGPLLHGLGSPFRHDADRLRADVADTDGTRLEGRRGRGRAIGEGSAERTAWTGRPLPDTDGGRRPGWTGELGPSGWREPAHGGWWRTEPDVGRVAHGVPARVDRLRALGNAVVPQVVEVIGQRLIQAHQEDAA